MLTLSCRGENLSRVNNHLCLPAAGHCSSPLVLLSSVFWLLFGFFVVLTVRTHFYILLAFICALCQKTWVLHFPNNKGILETVL